MRSFVAEKKTCSLCFALSLALLSGVGAFYAGMAYAPRPKVTLVNSVRPAAYPAYFQPAPTETHLSIAPLAAISPSPVAKVDKEEEAMNLPPLPKYGMAALGEEGAWAGDETSMKNGIKDRDHKGNPCLEFDADKISIVTLRRLMPPKGEPDSCAYRSTLSWRADITPDAFFSDEMSDMSHVVTLYEIEKFYRGGKWGIKDFEKLANLEIYNAALPLYLILKQANSPVAQSMLERKDTRISLEPINQFLETGICPNGQGPFCLDQ